MACKGAGFAREDFVRLRRRVSKSVLTGTADVWSRTAPMLGLLCLDVPPRSRARGLLDV